MSEISFVVHNPNTDEDNMKVSSYLFRQATINNAIVRSFIDIFSENDEDEKKQVV